MPPSSVRYIGGCLSRDPDAWESIGSEEWVLSVLRHGYRIPFRSRPPLAVYPLDFGSYSPGSERGKALDLEVSVLLNKGAVETAPSTPGFYSRLFVVPKASGGFRPVLDLSALNAYVHTAKFRMETIATVLSAVRRNDWMVSIDLKDAYFQILVHPESRKYLRLPRKDNLFSSESFASVFQQLPRSSQG